MRWLDFILDNPTILNDFMQDTERQLKTFAKEGQDAVVEGNLNKAQIAFGKAQVFESLINRISINISERKAQDDFQQKQTSGKSTRK